MGPGAKIAIVMVMMIFILLPILGVGGYFLWKSTQSDGGGGNDGGGGGNDGGTYNGGGGNTTTTGGGGGGNTTTTGGGPVVVGGTGQTHPEQVFNIFGGSGYSTGWGKDGAQQQCQALGARLATRSEVEAAQAAGAGWCHAGWVSDASNMAIWPLQSSQYSAACGSNPIMFAGTNLSTAAKFGANCYGPKPADGGSPRLLPWGPSGYSK